MKLNNINVATAVSNIRFYFVEELEKIQSEKKEEEVVKVMTEFDELTLD